MSAFQISKTHLDIIVSGAIDLGFVAFLPPANAPVKITRANASAFGRMLWAENVRSVQYRYPVSLTAQQRADELKAANEYEFAYYPFVQPVALLKLAQCLNYQSCERSDYNQSNTALALHALIGRLTIDGEGNDRRAYDAAPWAIGAPAEAHRCQDPAYFAAH